MSENSSGCGCGNNTPNPAANADEQQNLLANTQQEETTTCPVMVGTPVVKAIAETQGLYRDHDGQRYWFCCASCGPVFDSDPAKYAANMA